MGGKIEKLIHDGNPVGPYRVWADDEGPGIAMTRTLGDL
jgi:integrin-linked kinase-associated serine/threonine phosphatase 2C